jgi:HEXXH motif-containing protein
MIGRSESGELRSSHDLRQNPVARVLGRDLVCLFQDNLLCPGGSDIREKVVDGDVYSLPERLQLSLELLSVQSPRYYRWVTALLRAVAPWSNPLNSLPGGSGSSNLLPGTVAISASPAREPMIDSLIHEVCHHYFYLALKLGKMARDSERLFYNPVLRCDRPIEMILLAFHAFANVYRYCGEAMDRGVGDRDYFAYRMAMLREQLPVLDAHLASCGTLTELGKSIWLPLHYELAPILENSEILAAE